MIAFAEIPPSPADQDLPFPDLNDAFFDRLFNADPDSFELAELAEFAEAALGIDLPAQLKWQPRPDQPERFDQQTGFYNCPSRGVVWLLGGNGAGCLGAEQEVYDPVANQSCKVSEIDGPFHVWARTSSGEAVVAKASRPCVYGKEDLYRVTLSNGRSVVVTLGHRVLSDSGDWKQIGDIVRSAQVSNSPPSSVAKKCQYPASESVKPFADHIGESKQSDSLKVPQCTSEQSAELANSSRNGARHVALSSLFRVPSFYVTSIEFVRHDEYWDFSVDEHENYWMEGAWHHNTTETTMAKVAKFVLNTPAPRKDTPFWVIGGSYEQSMETCWKEKLYGHGHILDDDIDWDRVAWYRPKQQLPFRVPLLPTYCQADRELFRRLIPEQFPYDPRGNWSLEFKSWRQGADQMMARSIGGFAFVEQFPWGVFTEVLRGCREYNLPGSKMVEYTPVDPDLSGDIEEMIQNGKRPKSEGDDGKVQPERITLRSNMKFLPDDWEVFHANTECAMEAGHVSKEWFDEYFGMIPKESLGMRLKGLFAAFEGVIYKSFDPTVHVVGDEIFDWILSGNCSHRRAIDWGAGPQNAFVCLWGARNRLSQWFIYDEMYSTDQEKTTVDHLVDVTKRHPWPNQPWYGTTYADPASPGNIRLAQQLAKYGPPKEDIPNLNMSMARNAVIEGIEHVQWLLKRSIPEWNEFTESMIQRPRLFIHYSCVNLIREIKKYRWVKSDGANGQSLNPLNPRPEPLKFDDHCMDALRYLTFSDDSQLGLTIESVRSSSKAAQNVAKSSGNWRDLLAGNGLETSFGGRYGRGKKSKEEFEG